MKINIPHFTTYLTANIEHHFSFSLISSIDMSNFLQGFKPKSTGYNQLFIKLIKGATDSLSNALALIINQSLTTGIFPDKLKLATKFVWMSAN